jgi:phosphate transport system substrate-binding protein
MTLVNEKYKTLFIKKRRLIMKKKIVGILAAAVIGTTAFATVASAASGTINVISREDGSGTRGAFIELFGIQEEKDGEKVDMTTVDASITNSTSVMMTTVAGDENAIGYISLGSLNDTVKAVKIDGAEATAENVASDTYKVSRPFNIVTGEKASEAAQDFVNYIMSEEGQQIIEDNGYIKADAEAKPYEAADVEGKVVVAGSSSISPVMEKLKEAYEAVNKNVTVEVQQSDSTTGVTSAAEGICDIGMASRELKDEETEMNLTATVIAKDGIAVVVNNENEVEDLTSDQVKAIFTGETTEWEDLAE